MMILSTVLQISRDWFWRDWEGTVHADGPGDGFGLGDGDDDGGDAGDGPHHGQPDAHLRIHLHGRHPLCLLGGLVRIIITSIIIFIITIRSPTTAAYFCFVTLTTIGFGDYTPVKSFNGFEHDPVAAMKMVFTVSYCIFGMTLLSMCMNLMQEQIVEKVMMVATLSLIVIVKRFLGWPLSWACLGMAMMRRLSNSASRGRWRW